MTIREIAEDFIKRMNPSGWNGLGEKPSDFDTRIITYELDGHPNSECDIHFENDTDRGWYMVIKGRDKASGDYYGGYWINGACFVSVLERALKGYWEQFD